jgi:hypothetical protein
VFFRTKLHLFPHPLIESSVAVCSQSVIFAVGSMVNEIICSFSY